MFPRQVQSHWSASVQAALIVLMPSATNRFKHSNQSIGQGRRQARWLAHARSGFEFAHCMDCCGEGIAKRPLLQAESQRAAGIAGRVGRPHTGERSADTMPHAAPRRTEHELSMATIDASPTGDCGGSENAELLPHREPLPFAPVSAMRLQFRGRGTTGKCGIRGHLFFVAQVPSRKFISDPLRLTAGPGTSRRPSHPAAIAFIDCCPWQTSSLTWGSVPAASSRVVPVLIISRKGVFPTLDHHRVCLPASSKLHVFETGHVNTDAQDTVCV